MIPRFDFFYDADLSKGLSAYREACELGDYVEYEAHVAALAERDSAIAGLRNRDHTLTEEINCIGVTCDKLQAERDDCRKWLQQIHVQCALEPLPEPLAPDLMADEIGECIRRLQRQLTEFTAERDAFTAALAKVRGEIAAARDRINQLTIALERIIAIAQPEHVCGLQGYNGMIDPPCPGCQP